MNKSALEILGWNEAKYTKNKYAININININNIEEIKKICHKVF